jgi:putative DNA primase/helicase
MNKPIDISAAASIGRIVGSAVLSIRPGESSESTVVDMGSFERQDDGTLRKAVDIPEDKRPIFKVFEVHTEVKQHGKLHTGVWYFGMTPPTARKEAEYTCEWICSPLYLDAVTHDGNDHSFGRQLRFINTNDQWKTWAMPMELLAGSGEDLRKALLDQGVKLDVKNKLGLLRYLNSIEPTKRIVCVNRVGWSNDRCDTFVFPNKALGFGRGLYTFQSSAAYHAEYASHGTLKGWQDGVAACAADNPVLMTTLSAAFAGPLLKPCGAESGGLHLFSGSSEGKTTVLRAAASVWGNPADGKHVRSWNTTANGLEGVAELFNDNTLVLDEINQADPRDVGKIVYAIGNEAGKSRADRTGAARPTARWRCLLLSSGEKSIVTIMASVNQRANAGQQVRVLDVPVKRQFGVYDDLRGFADGVALSNSIVAGAKEHYGVAGSAFLEKLTRDRRDWRKEYGDYRARREFAAEGEDGQVRRVGGRFALLALAGELAIDYGVVPWREGDAIVAASEMFRVWRKDRPSGNQEPHQILDAVRSFIERHGASRFAPMDRNSNFYSNGIVPEKTVYDRAGWKDDDFYYFHKDGMREALKGFDFKRALEVMRENRVLIPGKDGKSSTPKDPPGEKQQRLYVIKAEALDSE